MRLRRVILTSLSNFDVSPFRNLGYDPVRVSTIRLLPNRIEISNLTKNLLEGFHDSAAFLSPRSIRMINPSIEVIEVLSKMRLFAVGPSTKESLEEFGLKNTEVPNEYTSRALATLIVGQHLKLPFSSIALIRSGFANKIMNDELVVNGVPAREYRIYSPEVDPYGVERLLEELRLGADFVVFTSRSSFELMRNFLQPKLCSELRSLLERANLIAIGPETAKSLREFGLEPFLVADHSLRGVLSFLRGM